MRKPGLGVACFVLGSVWLVSVAARADDGALKRLRAANAATALEQDGLVPWHLKLAVQAVDATPGVMEKGTVEEWWASPMMYRIVYETASFHGTIGENAKGVYRSASLPQIPVQLELARRQVVHPMPTEEELFDYGVDMRRNEGALGPMECFVVSRAKLNQPFPPLGEFPAYCLKTGTDQPVLTLEFGREQIPRGAAGVFEKKAIVSAVVATQSGQPAMAARVEKLETVAPGSVAEYEAPADAVMQAGKPLLVSAGAASHQIKHNQTPVMPDKLASRLAGQEFVARVLVSREGKVVQVMPVSQSMPDFAGPCVEAVRQYVFKPFTKDGQAVEALTTITINF